MSEEYDVAYHRSHSVSGFHLARVHGSKQKDELEITTQINPVLHLYIFNGVKCPILMFSCGFLVCSCRFGLLTHVLTSEMM